MMKLSVFLIVFTYIFVNTKCDNELNATVTKGNTTHVAYGEIMGYASTNVPAYSNENDTYISYQSYYLYGVYMGMRWQCVEYARRWLFIRKGCVFKSIEGAADIWTDISLVQRVVDGKCFTLKKHYNGSPSPPKNESLLIYTRSGVDMPYGHVAIIVDVLPGFIRVAEENYHFFNWLRNYSREVPYRRINGSYYIEDEYPLFGWMTVEDNNQTKPLDETTINTMIKLNGSSVNFVCHNNARHPFISLYYLFIFIIFSRTIVNYLI